MAINNAILWAQHLGEDGLGDISGDKAGYVIDAHSDPLADHNLEEMNKSPSEDEEVNKNEPEHEGMSLDRSSRILRHMKEAKDMAMS